MSSFPHTFLYLTEKLLLPRRSTVAPHQFCVQLGDGKGRNKKEQTKEQRGEAISQLQEKVPALPAFPINRRENLPFLALTLA